MPSAPLSPMSLSSSGIQGLNLQSSSTILDPSWATKAQNMVFDNTNRLSARSGWVALNSSSATGTIGQVFEYLPITGANFVISATPTKLYSGTTTLTDITGSVAPTASNWKFVNFNGNVYGLQAGHPLIVWTGSGNFAAVTAATGAVPNGNELLSAFGRLWGVDSTGQVLQYCNLLDATNWNITGAGSFNLTSVWGTGNDSIVALAAFNNLLVVFGSRNIVIFQDGSGSVLGMNPINMAVSDMISGIGCAARDSVQNINGDDLAFLSSSGLQSLKRVIIERSNAIRNISLNVRDYLAATALAETPVGLRSTYCANNGLYLLLAPVSGVLFAFDTKIPLQDGTWRVTLWDNFIPSALYTLHDSATILSAKAGQLFQYQGMQDNGANFVATYESGWLDLGPDVGNREKMLKRLLAVFSSSGGGNVTFKWAYDFSTAFYTSQVTVQAISSVAQFGAAQFAVDQYGGGNSIFDVRVPTNSSGQFIKVGLDVTASQATFSLNQMQLFAKIGRLA